MKESDQIIFTLASDGSGCWERVETGVGNPDGKTCELPLEKVIGREPAD